MVSFNDWAVPPPQSQLSSSSLSANSGKRSKVRNETNKSIKSNGKGFSSRWVDGDYDYDHDYLNDDNDKRTMH